MESLDLIIIKRDTPQYHSKIKKLAGDNGILLDDENAATVFSFTFSNEELKSLAEECGFLIHQLMHIRGTELKESEISLAITKAAEKAGKSIDDLNIITAITWKKKKED